MTKTAELLPSPSQGAVDHLDEAKHELAIDQTAKVWDKIWAEPSLHAIKPGQRLEAARQTFELYQKAKAYVAPVIANFAAQTLTEAAGRPVIYAARDGLGAYQAATRLKQKFPNNYPNANQLKYAYLTRGVVWSSSAEQLTAYLHQLGLDDLNQATLLVDIGMYGSMLPDLRRVMPKLDARFLISKSSAIPGYAHGEHYQMYTMAHVSGNPAVHFLEDTFSGPIATPKALTEVDGRLAPNTHDWHYPPDVDLKRKYAVEAIADYVDALTAPPNPQDMSAVDELDAFLADRAGYQQLMVPHER